MYKKNELLEISSSRFMNLNNIQRYSGTKLVEPENLSQHIVDTIMIGIKVINKLNTLTDTSELDIEKYVMKAVYHDLEESVTGDIPRPLKYHDADTLSALKSVADVVALELFKDEFGEHYLYHHKNWINAKEGKEGFILKIVDTLTVVIKVIKEVSLLNNMYMLKVAKEVIKYLNELLTYLSVEEYNCPIDNELHKEYLRNLIKDSITTMQDLLENYNSPYVKIYNIGGTDNV